MDSFTDSSVDGLAGQTDHPYMVNQGVAELQKRWKNEKYAPELLPFCQELVDEHVEVVEHVMESLEEEKADGQMEDVNDPDRILRQIDCDRVQYVLKDYLRIRLWKLRQFPQHYLEPGNVEVLSEHERKYLRDTWEIKKDYLTATFIKHIPGSKQVLDEKMDLLDMVRRPDLHKHVYARIKADLPQINIPPSISSQGAEESQQPLSLVNGDTYLIRYHLLRDYFMNPDNDGKVELV